MKKSLVALTILLVASASATASFQLIGVTKRLEKAPSDQALFRIDQGEVEFLRQSTLSDRYRQKRLATLNEECSQQEVRIAELRSLVSQLKQSEAGLTELGGRREIVSDLDSLVSEAERILDTPDPNSSEELTRHLERAKNFSEEIGREGAFPDLLTQSQHDQLDTTISKLAESPDSGN